MNIEDFVGTGPAFQPEEYFLGKTKAWGFFQDRFGTIRREFTVDIEGSIDNGDLILDEHFVYRDGEREHRVWRITKLGGGRYQGRADDVVGVATGKALGRAMRWEYAFDLPVGDSTWRVWFDDWMFLQDDGVMMNRSTISKLGLKLGEVVIYFQRQADSVGDNSARIGQPASDSLHTAA